MITNPFALFDLPVDFNVDQAALSARYLALQKSLHPDNFAHASGQEQRLAMQKSAEINDALQILKDPIARADSIIAIHTGEQQDLEQKSNHDMTFLMQQLSWREQLEEIEHNRDVTALADFTAQVEQSRQAYSAEINTALAERNWRQAQMLNDRLRFIRKLTDEIERIEETLAGF
ncbi:Fe-S protein assembly co-chaperone HscB [Pasteurellaceae bacterium LIM206]|nr:Fe-S protein assembly co-chaperone HscB [Pasteurellaceae bacterium LIM206]